MERQSQSEEILGGAVAGVITATAEQLALRLELALLDGRRIASEMAVRCALMFLGGLVLLGAILTVDLALVSLARSSAADGSGAAALLVAAAIHAAIGATLFAVALRKSRGLAT